MNNKTEFSTLLTNSEVLEALSDAGVFIRDLKKGTALVSRTWKQITKDILVIPDRGEFVKLIHPDDVELTITQMDDIIQGKIREGSISFRIQDGNGSYKWIRSKGRGASYSNGSKPDFYVGCEIDITELKEAESRLIRSIQREQDHCEELELLRQMAASISTSLDINETVQRILDETYRIIPYETASLQLRKGDVLQIIGASGFKDNEHHINKKYPLNAGSTLNAKSINDRAPVMTGDVSEDFPDFLQPDDGTVISSWLGIPLIVRGEVLGLMTLDDSRKDYFTEHDLQLARIIGDHIAIALENALFHEKAYRMAIEDSLTGVGNRHRMQLEGRLLFETAARAEEAISVAILDIDHFKDVNDNFGHDKGDIILKRIAGLCSAELRITDLLVRFGGEEFLIIFPKTDSSEAFTVCERIRKCIASQEHPELDRKVTISIGLYSSVPGNSGAMGSFIAQADKALYHSKTEGRNRTTAT